MKNTKGLPLFEWEPVKFKKLSEEVKDSARKNKDKNIFNWFLCKELEMGQEDFLRWAWEEHPFYTDCYVACRSEGDNPMIEDYMLKKVKDGRD